MSFIGDRPGISWSCCRADLAALFETSNPPDADSTELPGYGPEGNLKLWQHDNTGDGTLTWSCDGQPTVQLDLYNMKGYTWKPEQADTVRLYFEEDMYYYLTFNPGVRAQNFVDTLRQLVDHKLPRGCWDQGKGRARARE